ncbi:DUF1629 domain-containing protein [Leptospira sp. WS92.C1]
MKKKTTTFYLPFSLEGYELCHPVEPFDFENLILQVNGIPRATAWRPIDAKVIHKDEGRKLSESDAPWLGSHALILRQRAVDVMRGLLDEFGELLPLSCAEAKLYIYNPTRVLDALDVDASSVLRFSDGQLMTVNRYSFKTEVINGVHAFKISDLRASPTFVSEVFVQTWNSAGLRGLDFKKVWSE